MALLALVVGHLMTLRNQEQAPLELDGFGPDAPTGIRSAEIAAGDNAQESEAVVSVGMPTVEPAASFSPRGHSDLLPHEDTDATLSLTSGFIEQAEVAIEVCDALNQAIGGAHVELVSGKNPETRAPARDKRVKFSGITDDRGNCRLIVPSNALSSRNKRLLKAQLRVTHERYVSFHGRVAVDSGVPIKVKLDAGCTVILEPVAEAGQVLELAGLNSFGAIDRPQWNRATWTSVDNEEWMSVQVPEGESWIAVRGVDANGEFFWSQVFSLNASPLQLTRVRICLSKVHPLKVVLSANVPRPVRNGEVLARVLVGVPADSNARIRGDRGKLIAVQEHNPVASDGSLCIPGLPPGTVQFIAICDGWTTKQGRRGQPDSVSREPAHLGRRTPTEGRPSSRQPPSRDGSLPRFSSNGPPRSLSIQMERAACIRALVLDSKAEPVSGARIVALPVYRFADGMNMAMHWREWSSRTDEQGIATVCGLPSRQVQRVACCLDSGGACADGDYSVVMVATNEGETSECTILSD